MVYDVVVIGSGAAGLFAAMEIVGYSHLNVLVLEKARRLNDSRNVSLGWLGGSARAGVKMFLEEGFGGFIDDTDIIDIFTERVEEYTGSKVRVSKKTLLKRSLKRAESCGIQVDQPKTFVCSEDKMIKMGDFLYSYLREHATVRHKIEISRIEKKGRYFQIHTDEETYKAKNVVVGLGRGGSRWLREHSNFKLKLCGDHYDFGVRLEFPNKVFKGFADKSHNFRLRYDDFRTSVPTFSGSVETEEVGSVRLSNGRSWGQNKSHLANFSLMRRFKVDSPEECVYRVSEILNVLSDGQLMRDALGSVLSGSNIARNLPDFEAVLEGFPKLLELFPGLKKRCTVYAPEARLNALKYDLNEGMESKISGLYIVGDMSGHTNSFVQAACSGLIASFHILEKYGV